MVKVRTLVPWDTIPMWVLWLGLGGSEYRFTCEGEEHRQGQVRIGADPR